MSTSPLISILYPLVPQVIKLLAGDTDGSILQKVSDATMAVTGSITDATVIKTALSDPDKLLEFGQALADIELMKEQSYISSQIKISVASIPSTFPATQKGSPLNFGTPLVSFLVLTTFGIVMFMALSKSLPPGSETILNMLLGSLSAMAVSIVSYWVGSSSGSAAKTEMIYKSTPTPPTP